jgi:predicted ATP-grasp superfamily ATP-dependent carboligase
MNVQEWIPGDERNLLIFGSYRGRRGEILASFTARKRLQYPPLVGTGIVVEALPVPEIEDASQALLESLGFFGVSEIEFKRDERDERLYLVEINPRHWDQHRLGTKVGVNLSEAAYRDATGQPVPAMTQASGRALWLAEQGLAYHVRRVVKRRAPVAQLLEVFGAPRTWAVFDFSDPRPFLSMLGIVRSMPKGASASVNRSAPQA